MHSQRNSSCVNFLSFVFVMWSEFYQDSLGGSERTQSKESTSGAWDLREVQLFSFALCLCLCLCLCLSGVCSHKTPVLHKKTVIRPHNISVDVEYPVRNSASSSASHEPQCLSPRCTSCDLSPAGTYQM